MNVSRVLLSASALTIACWSAPSAPTASADQPRTPEPAAQAACPAGPRYYLKANGEELELRKDPAATQYDELAVVEWRKDLNGDGVDDLGLRLMGTTGSKGESMWGIFVDCGGGQFVAAWGPEYVVSIELPPSSARADRKLGKWIDLVAVTRVEQANRQQHDRIEKHTLRFARGRYRQVHQ